MKDYLLKKIFLLKVGNDSGPAALFHNTKYDANFLEKKKQDNIHSSIHSLLRSKHFLQARLWQSINEVTLIIRLK